MAGISDLCPEIYRQTVIVECQDCMNLSDPNTFKSFMYDLCGLLDVTVVLGPRVISYEDDDNPEKNGVSASLVFAESGMHMHSWPEYSFLRFDMWSCKPFNSKYIRQALMQWFMPMKIVMKQF